MVTHFEAVCLFVCLFLSWHQTSQHAHNSTGSNKMAAKNFIFKGKLVVVGDIAVGKTSIVSRLTENKFVQTQPSSVGVAYSSKTIRVDPTTTVKFDIWDTAGVNLA